MPFIKVITGIRRSGKSTVMKLLREEMNTQEIDFIAPKQNEKLYTQVAYQLESEQTVQREFSPLQAIADNHSKYVITMDDFWQENIDGIVHRHIRDFVGGRLIKAIPHILTMR